jgi:hypothetical protein
MVIKRPDVHTKFHIDLDWWRKSHKDIGIYMKDLLCAECKETLSGYTTGEEYDWVDDENATVTQEEALWHTIRTCCGQKPDYITPGTPIIDAIFMTFLANGNKPLSIQELHKKIDKRPPDFILRMLTKGQVYMGLRPAREE